MTDPVYREMKQHGAARAVGLVFPMSLAAVAAEKADPETP